MTLLQIIPSGSRYSPIAALKVASIIIIALGITSCSFSNKTDPVAIADLILKNAKVYTVEDDHVWAESVAVRDSKILAVGTDEEIKAYLGKETQVLDLDGRLVMPAFGDLHVHPVFGGMAQSRCPLMEGKGIKEYQAMITKCMAKTPGDGPLYGVGWDDSLFPPKGIPNKKFLDKVSTQRPLIFLSLDGHSIWVNSAALQLARITKDTEEPLNGTIYKDPETGEPVGALLETAMDLMEDFIPKPTAAEMQQSILYVADLFNGFGITSWHDAGIDLDSAGNSEILKAYRAVKNSGDLTSRVSIAFKWRSEPDDNEDPLDQIDLIKAASQRAEEWGLQAKAVKFYIDGVIPQQTAAMIEPYEHRDDAHRGLLQVPPEILNTAVTRLSVAGFQSHSHAIGDGAARAFLDAVEVAQKANNGNTLRPLISHLNVVEPGDHKRFAELDVIAVFQPLWATNYPYMDLTKRAIGEQRSQYIYPVNSITSAGGMIAYGADWPVASANPFHGLEVAVTRTDVDDLQALPLLPDEGVTLRQAVRSYTYNVAYANNMENITGTIKPGKSADLIITNQNIFEIPVKDISQTEVLLTLFKGRAVHGKISDFTMLKTQH